MKKKRKHKLTLHDQKIIAARHKNAFMEKLKYFTVLWLGKGSFDMFPAPLHIYPCSRAIVSRCVNLKELLNPQLFSRIICWNRSA